MRSIEVAAGILIDKKKRVLLSQRSHLKIFPLQWEFPGGKLKENESIEFALIRELKEELNIETKIQLSATDQDDMSPSVLSSLIVATTKFKEVDVAVSECVLEAWRNTQSLEFTYQKGDQDETRRIDIHALFLSNGVWYYRALMEFEDSML